MPKRKLRLWYSKDDYKKEREDELAQRQKMENENLTAEPTVDVAAPESTATDNQIQQVENEQAVTAEEKAEQIQQPEEVQLTASSETEITKPEEPVIEETTQKATLEQAAPIIPPVASAETNQATPTEEKMEKSSDQAKDVPIADETQKDLIPVAVEQQQAQIQEVQAEASVVTPIEVPEAVKQEEAPVSTEVVQSPFVGPIQEEAEPSEVEMKVPLIASVESIENYTQSLKSLLPTRAIVCIGEYPINILLKGNFAGKKGEGVLPLFVEKSTKDVVKWSQGKLDEGSIVGIDEEIDSHFWYNVSPTMANNEGFFGRVKSKPLEKLKGAILVSSTWTGVGSALLPMLNTRFKDWKVNSVALALLPSKAQPLDGQFNSFASIGRLTMDEPSTTLLLDRDNIEDFTGVDRKGSPIEGNQVINYIIELMLSREDMVPELCEMSKAFNSKMFTIMLAPGLSWKLYGSLDNMLNTALPRPLLDFDLSTSSLLYVLIRMPFQLKDKLSRGKIELAVANWFKDKADLESIFIADPVFAEDSSDRIDIAMFIGGFDTATRYKALQLRLENMKNKAVKKAVITEEEWQVISKNLIE